VDNELTPAPPVNHAVVEVVPTRPERDSHGHFLPGNREAAGNAGPNASKRMMSELSKRLEESGPKGNPLLCMHSIMLDLEQPVKVRLLAAHKITQFLLPTLSRVSLDQPSKEALETEATRVTETLRTFFTKKEN